MSKVPVIDLRDIAMTYSMSSGQKFYALRDIHLKVLPGDFLAIMGASGSGKTTLSNIIGFLSRPSSGNYFFLGENVAKTSDSAFSSYRSNEIGFIFQDYLLIEHLSALENVALPLIYKPELSRPEMLDMAAAQLKQLGLGQKLHHFPNQLSGGQKQRVAIARALIKKPSLILADEPAGALDVKSRLDVLSILQDLNELGVTIVMVTHSSQDAMAGSRLVVIDGGRITEDSPQTRRMRFFPAEATTKSNQNVDIVLADFLISKGVEQRPDWLYVASLPLKAESHTRLLKSLDPAWLSDKSVRMVLQTRVPIASQSERVVLFCLAAKNYDILKEEPWLAPFLDEMVSAGFSETEAFDAISACEKAPAEVIQKFIRIENFLEHPSARVRATAVKVLKKSELHDSIAVQEIVEKLFRDPDGRVRANTLEVAVELGASIPYLQHFGFEKDAHPRVRVAWAMALLEAKEYDALSEILVPMLESQDPGELKAAAFVLSSGRGSSLVYVLRKLIKSNPNQLYLLNIIGETLERAKARQVV